MKTVLKFQVTRVNAVRKEQDRASHIHLHLALTFLNSGSSSDCEVHYTLTAPDATSPVGSFPSGNSTVEGWRDAVSKGAGEVLKKKLDEIAENYLAMLARVDEAIHEDGPGRAIKSKPESVEICFEHKNPKRYEILEDVNYTVQRVTEEPVEVVTKW